MRAPQSQLFLGTPKFAFYDAQRGASGSWKVILPPGLVRYSVQDHRAEDSILYALPSTLRNSFICYSCFVLALPVNRQVQQKKLSILSFISDHKGAPF